MLSLFISRPLTDAVVAAARAEFDTTIRVSTTPMTAAEMTEALAAYDIIIPTLGDRFTRAIFAAVARPRCRLLANFGAGIDHIDVAAARAYGISVTNTPGAVTEATADVAVMLMLMSCRRAAEGERLVRTGRWEGWHPTQMLGLHVTGKTLGIVGMGRIGQAVAKRAHFGFNMQILWFSRSARTLPFPNERCHRLHEILRRADVVVLAVPGGAATRHLIGPAELALMQPHAHLINVSRGDVVDEGALIEALTAQRIGGAALDVYEHEPEVPERLRTLDNVTLLPHLGTATEEVRTAMGMMALENARAFRDGRPLPNPV